MYITSYCQRDLPGKSCTKFAPNVNLSSPYGSTTQTLQLKHAWPHTDSSVPRYVTESGLSQSNMFFFCFVFFNISTYHHVIVLHSIICDKWTILALLIITEHNHVNCENDITAMPKMCFWYLRKLHKTSPILLENIYFFNNVRNQDWPSHQIWKHSDNCRTQLTSLRHYKCHRDTNLWHNWPIVIT